MVVSFQRWLFHWHACFVGVVCIPVLRSNLTLCWLHFFSLLHCTAPGSVVASPIFTAHLFLSFSLPSFPGVTSFFFVFFFFGGGGVGVGGNSSHVYVRWGGEGGRYNTANFSYRFKANTGTEIWREREREKGMGGGGGLLKRTKPEQLLHFQTFQSFRSSAPHILMEV